jgi:hypothetical protein
VASITKRPRRSATGKAVCGVKTPDRSQSKWREVHFAGEHMRDAWGGRRTVSGLTTGPWRVNGGAPFTHRARGLPGRIAVRARTFVRVSTNDSFSGRLAEDGGGVQNRAHEVRHDIFPKAVPEAGSQTDPAGPLALDAALRSGSARDSRAVNGDPPFTRFDQSLDPVGGSPTSTRGSRVLPSRRAARTGWGFARWPASDPGRLGAALPLPSLAAL